MNKQDRRCRRARRTRAKIQELSVVRLTVHRSHNHIYAQMISPDNARVLAAASTLDKELRSSLGHGGNKASAAAVGRLVAERAKAANINEIAFDRSGYKYHGRVRALAEAVRESGIKF